MGKQKTLNTGYFVDTIKESFESWCLRGGTSNIHVELRKQVWAVAMTMSGLFMLVNWKVDEIVKKTMSGVVGTNGVESRLNSVLEETNGEGIVGVIFGGHLRWWRMLSKQGGRCMLDVWCCPAWSSRLKSLTGSNLGLPRRKLCEFGLSERHFARGRRRWFLHFAIGSPRCGGCQFMRATVFAKRCWKHGWDGAKTERSFENAVEPRNFDAFTLPNNASKVKYCFSWVRNDLIQLK